MRRSPSLCPDSGQPSELIDNDVQGCALPSFALGRIEMTNDSHPVSLLKRVFFLLCSQGSVSHALIAVVTIKVLLCNVSEVYITKVLNNCLKISPFWCCYDVVPHQDNWLVRYITGVTRHCFPVGGTDCLVTTRSLLNMVILLFQLRGSRDITELHRLMMTMGLYM